MLMAHGEYNLPYEVVGLQFCNYEGDKISKSRNWGIFCEKVVEAGLHPDIWRYYFAHLIPETKDTEFKWEEFENRVNNELVANIGNFIHRTLSFIWNYFDGEIRRTRLSPEDRALLRKIRYEVRAIERLFERVRLRDALGRIVQLAKLGNEYFQRHEPWRLVKTDPERCRQVLYFCANLCNKLAILLYPYLPSSSQKILEYLGLDARPEWRNLAKPLPSTRIKKPEILFRKLERGELERVKALVTKSSPLEEYFREPLEAPA
jgi:methionyl-tRNA synthetase